MVRHPPNLPDEYLKLGGSTEPARLPMLLGELPELQPAQLFGAGRRPTQQEAFDGR